MDFLKCELPGEAGGAARTVIVPVKPSDIVNCERKYKISLPEKGAALSYECNLYVAYVALRRRNELEDRMTFDQFVDYVDDVEPTDDDSPLVKPSDS